jgi:hypothetical protein
MFIAALCRFVCPVVVTLTTVQAASVTLDSPRDYQVFHRSSIEAGAILVRGSAHATCEAATEWSDRIKCTGRKRYVGVNVVVSDLNLSGDP